MVYWDLEQRFIYKTGQCDFIPDFTLKNFYLNKSSLFFLSELLGFTEGKIEYP